MCKPMPPSQDWGERRFLNDTNDVQFLCRCSACLGGCGATASQTEGERRGPDAGEALPAKDCPAEPPVPSYTQLTASSAEAPSEGNSTNECVCVCVGARCIVGVGGRRWNHFQNTQCWNQTGWVISLPKLITKALRKRERGRERWGRGGSVSFEGVCWIHHNSKFRAGFVGALGLCVCVFITGSPAGDY